MTNNSLCLPMSSGFSSELMIALAKETQPYRASKLRRYCQRISRLLNALPTPSQRNGRPSCKNSKIKHWWNSEKLKCVKEWVGYSRIFEVDVHEPPILFTLRKSNGTFNELVLLYVYWIIEIYNRLYKKSGSNGHNV